MMKNTLYLFVAILCFACKQQQPQEPIKEEEAILLSELADFTIPFNRDFSDSNQLFFISTEYFDTTFIYHIRKTKDDIRGIVYMTFRGKRPTTDDLSNPPKSGVAPFAGFGFILNEEKWQELVSQVNIVIKDSAAIRNRLINGPSCTDGTPRKISFNGIVIEATNCGDSTMEKLANYLQQSIVWKLTERQN